MQAFYRVMRHRAARSDEKWSESPSLRGGERENGIRRFFLDVAQSWKSFRFTAIFARRERHRRRLLSRAARGRAPA